MSSWGNKDTVASPGTITVTGVNVANGPGAATFFANNYAVGQTVDLLGGGSAVIVSITNNTVMVLASNTELTAASITREHTVSEKPVYIIEGDATTLANTVYGVSIAEQRVSNNLVTTTSNTQAVIANTGAHAGWTKLGDVYTDANGNLRRKNEVLVAMSTITGDAEDDTVLPDS